jgi:hypothetical protein
MSNKTSKILMVGVLLITSLAFVANAQASWLTDIFYGKKSSPTVTVVEPAVGARTSNYWDEIAGSYMRPNYPGGEGLLIYGSNKYVNFGSTYGTSGYGIRDNSGTIEFKNSGGSWAGVGTGSGGGSGGSISTSSPLTAGLLIKSTAWNTIANIATSSLGLPQFSDLTGYLTSIYADSPLSGSGTSGSHLIFTNPGYITSSALSPYLLTANAFTQAIASTTFQPIIGTNTYDPYGQATSSINALTFNYPLTRATNAISLSNMATSTPTNGTGISLSGTGSVVGGSLSITNSAPDQTVVLNNGTGISVSGTYPTFTITNTGSTFSYPFPNNATTTALTFGDIIAKSIAGDGNSGNAFIIRGKAGASSAGQGLQFAGGAGDTGYDGADISFLGGNGAVGHNGGNVIFQSGLGLAGTNGTYKFYSLAGSKYGIFDFSNIATSDKTFTFPNTSGTLALISNINTIAKLNSNLSGETIASTSATMTGLINSTATGNSYFTGGNVGIGTTSPYAQFSIATPNGATGSQTTLFAIASSTQAGATSTLMTVLANGNVGIGTIAPTGKLSIDSHINSSGYGFYLNSLTRTPGDTTFYMTGSAAGNEFVVNSNGRVGIGTTSPAYLLDVAGSSGQVGLFGDANNGGNIYVGFSSGGSYPNGRAFLGYNGTSGNAVVQGVGSKGIEFNVNNNTFGSGQAMVINSSSYVGIGTTTPAAKLHIVGATEQLRLGYNGQNYSSFTIGADGALNISPTNSATTTVANAFQAAANFYVLNNGNVGIGTTSPYSLFSISNNLNTPANTPLFTIASTTAGTATSTLMTVLANGNVGIGTTAPAYKLDVNGNARVDGTLTATTFIGALTGTASGNLISSNINSIAKINSYLSGETVASTSDAMTALSDATWTLHNSYPAACGANTWTTSIGDTLTCSAITYAGITAMSSANFAGLINDETGSGLVVLQTSPTLITPTLGNASSTQMGISGRLYIPNSTDPTISIAGDLGINTTAASSSLRYWDGAEMALYPTQYKTITVASTTLDVYAGRTASSTIPLGVASPQGETWTEISCYTDAGTAQAEFGDGTNFMNYVMVSSTTNTKTSLSNNTFTTREKRYIRIGQTSGFNSLTCSVGYYQNAP